MAHHERMANADAAWLHMDSPTNLMVIVSVLWFDEALPLERLREVCRVRLVERYPRFRQRVAESPLPLGAPAWHDDEAFDLDAHLHHIALPPPGDRAALQELVADLMATPLDRTKPLWHMHLVEGYGDGSALIVRMHHCIADGIALARVMLSLTDDAPDAGIAATPAVPASRGRRRLGPLRAIFAPAATVIGVARGAAGAIVHEAIGVARRPARLVDLAAAARDDAAALGKLVLLGSDAATVFKGDLGVAQRVAWSDGIPLEDVRAIGHAHGATVNDVLLSAVAGALHGYLAQRESLVEELRAIVPFNLRPLDEPLPASLGNRFGLVYLPLPVGLADRTARLEEVKRRMDAIKHSAEGAVAYGVLEAVGLTPVQIEHLIVDVFTAKGTAVMTNVPGPRETVYLAGVPVRGVLVWAPRSGGVSTSVTIFSYAGEVTIGLAVDAGLVPDPETIVRAFDAELTELHRAVRGRPRSRGARPKPAGTVPKGRRSGARGPRARS